jgi:hypothetical protein
MATLNLVPHRFHGDWNYTVHPMRGRDPGRRGHQSADVPATFCSTASTLLLYRTRFPGHQRGMSGYGSRDDRRSWRHGAIAFSA